jgi:hypothetical protein
MDTPLFPTNFENDAALHFLIARQSIGVGTDEKSKSALFFLKVPFSA